MIGQRVDFVRNRRRLFALSLVGAFVGNLPGFYAYQPAFISGGGWEIGFGYVTGFGIPEPSLIINLFVATVAIVMIPIAGLALAHFRIQSKEMPVDAVEAGRTGEAYTLRLFSVAGLMIAATVGPLEQFALNILTQRFGSDTSVPVRTLEPWPGLISGYLGFLVYPVLLMITFYQLGKRLPEMKKHLRLFMASLYAVGITGFLSTVILSDEIQRPPMPFYAFSTGNLLNLTLESLVSGALFLAIGFASASLGYVTTHSSQTANQSI